LSITITYLADHEAFVPAIAKWQQDQFGYLNPAGTLEQRDMRLREALARDRLPMALVAIDEDGELVGSAGIMPTTLTHQHLTPWLSSVYVPPEQRGRGIASLLSLRACEEAARLGYETIYLFTPSSENLYARLGWTTFDTVTHRGVQLAIMSRPSGAKHFEEKSA
jgi:predicted N-acetyltransferase YhbS